MPGVIARFDGSDIQVRELSASVRALAGKSALGQIILSKFYDHFLESVLETLVISSPELHFSNLDIGALYFWLFEALTFCCNVDYTY